jgi:vacuolar-type H+-ATPase subunit I/STV1
LIGGFGKRGPAVTNTPAPIRLLDGLGHWKETTLMKQFPALVAAFAMTGMVGLSMLGIGANALLNPHTQPTLNSATDQAQVSTVSNASAQVQQLEAQIAQYQSREQQYQSREQQYQSEVSGLQQQVSQEQSQVQAFAQLLGELQQRGVISIRGDGTILIPRR